MFGLKKRGEELSGEILTISEKIARIYKYIGELFLEVLTLKAKTIETVECDVCGCLLNKKTAIRRKSTVEQFLGEEQIKEHYFCKIHAPKAKKK